MVGLQHAQAIVAADALVAGYLDKYHKYPVVLA